MSYLILRIERNIHMYRVDYSLVKVMCLIFFFMCPIKDKFQSSHCNRLPFKENHSVVTAYISMPSTQNIKKTNRNLKMLDTFELFKRPWALFLSSIVAVNRFNNFRDYGPIAFTCQPKNTDKLYTI